MKLKSFIVPILGALFLVGCSSTTTNGAIPEAEYEHKFEANYERIQTDLGELESTILAGNVDDIKTYASYLHGSLEVSKEVMEELTPPEKYEETNELLIDSLEWYMQYANQTLDRYITGTDEGSSTSLQEGTDSLIEANDLFQEAKDSEE